MPKKSCSFWRRDDRVVTVPCSRSSDTGSRDTTTETKQSVLCKMERNVFFLLLLSLPVPANRYMFFKHGLNIHSVTFEQLVFIKIHTRTLKKYLYNVFFMSDEFIFVH